MKIFPLESPDLMPFKLTPIYLASTESQMIILCVAIGSLLFPLHLSLYPTPNAFMKETIVKVRHGISGTLALHCFVLFFSGFDG